MPRSREAHLRRTLRWRYRNKPRITCSPAVEGGTNIFNLMHIRSIGWVVIVLNTSLSTPGRQYCYGANVVMVAPIYPLSFIVTLEAQLNRETGHIMMPPTGIYHDWRSYLTAQLMHGEGEEPLLGELVDIEAAIQASTQYQPSLINF